MYFGNIERQHHIKNKNMQYKFLVVILISLVIFPGINAQNKSKKISVTGIVTDLNKNPVDGAMILIDNNYTNKSTNNKGFFKVRVHPDAEMVSVVTPDKGIGEALINGKTMLNITLRPGTAPLKPGNMNNQEGEERVDIGYGSVRRKDLTTPVNKLNIKNSRYANYSNIYDMLKGSVPGLQVSGTRITIQGTSSFNLSTEPLFIVDGMQVSSIGDISPTQVESVEVLKGSSASIYGSRGANGVILIKLIGANTNR